MFSIDLRPTGKSRLDKVANGVKRYLFAVELYIFGQFRTRSDKRLFAGKDAPELRQFIKPSSAQKGSHACYRFFAVHPHTSELCNMDSAVPFSDAFLKNKDGTSIIKKNGKCDKGVKEKREDS